MIELPEGSWWDWDVVSWDPSRLVLGAGHDLTYHHLLELHFEEPEWVACPAFFQDPVFRAPTPAETTRVRDRLGTAPSVLIAFTADAGGPEPAEGLIAAGRLRVVEGRVYRYWRGKLGPGERHAPWVRRPE
ncbi:hypothetical protein [Kitasatospora griseola]|uniref:hypothetical protein n=1 Tax=Kitasatospora griseola TaxID=2064 RepID=UPI000699167A|nr:hypothetical protein [Kitasatospora griseola]